MKKGIILLAAVFIIMGCSGDRIVGSGDITSEFRDVSYFNRVSSEGVFEVHITKGNTQSVEITADDNIMSKVRTEVSGEKLTLRLKDGSYSNVHLSANITVLDLSSVSNSGSGDIHVYENTGEETVNVINSGSGDIYVEGSSEELNIDNEGSGDILAFDSPAEDCSIDNVGSGDIEVTCTGTLDVKIEGSGSVYYRGSPSINVSITGSGKVINRN